MNNKQILPRYLLG